MGTRTKAEKSKNDYLNYLTNSFGKWTIFICLIGLFLGYYNWHDPLAIMWCGVTGLVIGAFLAADLRLKYAKNVNMGYTYEDYFPPNT